MPTLAVYKADAAVLSTRDALLQRGRDPSPLLLTRTQFGRDAEARGLPDGAPGYAAALRCSRNSGALASSCLMLDCAAARAAGAFDEIIFPELYSATDLSLRLRAGGAHLIFAPRARFVARSIWHAPPAAALAAERDQLRRRWGENLLADPFYHPGLNVDAAPFTGLAWPPRPRSPRRRSRPRVRAAQDRTL